MKNMTRIEYARRLAIVEKMEAGLPADERMNDFEKCIAIHEDYESIIIDTKAESTSYRQNEWRKAKESSGLLSSNNINIWDLKKTFVGDDWIFSGTDSERFDEMITSDEFGSNAPHKNWDNSPKMVMFWKDGERWKKPVGLTDTAYDACVEKALASVYPERLGEFDQPSQIRFKFQGQYASAAQSDRMVRYNDMMSELLKDDSIHENDLMEYKSDIYEITRNYDRNIAKHEPLMDRMIFEDCVNSKGTGRNSISILQTIGPEHESEPSHLRIEMISTFAKCSLVEAIDLKRLYKSLGLGFNQIVKIQKLMRGRGKTEKPWNVRIDDWMEIEEINKRVKKISGNVEAAKLPRNVLKRIYLSEEGRKLVDFDRLFPDKAMSLLEMYQKFYVETSEERYQQEAENLTNCGGHMERCLMQETPDVELVMSTYEALRLKFGAEVIKKYLGENDIDMFNQFLVNVESEHGMAWDPDKNTTIKEDLNEEERNILDSDAQAQNDRAGVVSGTPIDRAPYTYWSLDVIPKNEIMSKDYEHFKAVIGRVRNARNTEELKNLSREKNSLNWPQKAKFSQEVVRRARQVA